MHQIIDKPKKLRLFDPTGTVGLRREFRKAAHMRVAQFREKIRQVVMDQRSLMRITPGEVKFDTGAMLDSFNRFCYYFAYADMAVPNWYNSFLKKSYLSGQEAAWGLMGKPAPIGFDEPDSSAYVAFQNELEGIADATLQNLGRVAHDILMRSDDPMLAFRKLALVLDKITVRRLDALAHHAVVKLHNVARLEEFHNAGHRAFGACVECVPPHKHMDAKRKRRSKPPLGSAIGEFVTAGDNDVCPVCEDLEGQVFTYSEAIGLIPVHPHCRCAWIPVRRLRTWKARSLPVIKNDNFRIHDDGRFDHGGSFHWVRP